MPDSVNVISYSSGTVEGSDIIFQVVFECNIIHPVEGMLISCEVENITKAGIKAKIPGEVSPLVIFVARDHNFNTSKFNNVNEKDIWNDKNNNLIYCKMKSNNVIFIPVIIYFVIYFI